MKFKDFTENELKAMKGKRIWFMYSDKAYSGLISHSDNFQMFIHNKEGIARFSIFGKHEFFYSYDELSDYLFHESINIGPKEKRIILRKEEDEKVSIITKISRSLFSKI